MAKEEKKKAEKAEKPSEEKKEEKKAEEIKEEAKDTEKKEGEEGAAEGEAKEGESGEKKGLSKKKLLIIVIAGGVLAIAGIVAGLAFFGLLPGLGHKEEEEVADPNKVPQINYYDMEEFLVNLNNPGAQVSFLKLRVTLELPDLAAKAAVEQKLPRIRDSFQVYLRELRSGDLYGTQGAIRLKEELLLRINKIIEPEKVNEILFKEIIVQ